MKKREVKALELIDTGKQARFDGIPEKEPKVKERGGVMDKKTTYWICENKHVFPIKFAVLKERRERLRCPICSAKVKNKSTKSTYLYYLHKQGRGHERNYRKSMNKLATNK